MANEHEHDDKDEFNLSGFGKTEEYVPTSTREGNSTIHAHLRQELAKHDQLNKNECTSMVMMSEGKQKKPEPVMNEDCSSESNEKWDQPIQLNPRPCDSSQGMNDDIDDHIQLSAQPDAREAISSFVVESHRESNKQPEVLRFNNNNVFDMSQNAKESQDELSKTNNKHMQMKAPPVMMNLYQYAMFANTMSGNHKGELQKEQKVARGEPAPSDNRSQKHPKKDAEHSKDNIVASNGCAEPMNHMTRTCSFGEDKVPEQCSHTSLHCDDVANSKLRQENVQCSSNEMRTDLGPSTALRQNLDCTSKLMSIGELDGKHRFCQKAPVAYDRPGELPTPKGQVSEAANIPEVASDTTWTQRYEERPGAYVIMSSGSAVETTRLPFAHENFSGHHDCDEVSQQDVMSNNQAQGHCDDEINMDEEQIAANENNPVEAEPVEAVFAEVVVWYKRPLYRWILVVVVVLVIAIIVLGVHLSAGASVPTLAPTLVQPLTPSESIACSFLTLSMDVCRETTSANRSVFRSTIPTELGVLTGISNLSLYDNELTGTIPSEMGAMTSLTYLDLSDNQLTGTIPSEIGVLTSLAYLDLTYDQLTGLSQNQLTGTIPSEMWAMTSLTFLSLSSNKLTGKVPSEIGEMTSLTHLDLSSNQLTGAIPSEMWAITSLTDLGLSSNKLTGKVPSEMGAMTSLDTLYLSSNQLTGTIPSEMGAMTNLTYLILWFNQLTGTIPSEMGALTRLYDLYLYDNQLTGTIPSEMGALTSLYDLNLSDNQLAGTIPSELSKLNASWIYLHNNSLSGTISTELCQSVVAIIIDCGEIECSCCSCN